MNRTRNRKWIWLNCNCGFMIPVIKKESHWIWSRFCSFFSQNKTKLAHEKSATNPPGHTEHTFCAVKRRLTYVFCIFQAEIDVENENVLVRIYLVSKRLLVLILWSVTSDRRFGSHRLCALCLETFFVCKWIGCNVFLLLILRMSICFSVLDAINIFVFQFSNLCNHEMLMNISCLDPVQLFLPWNRSKAKIFWKYSFFFHTYKKELGFFHSKFGVLCSFFSYKSMACELPNNHLSNLFHFVAMFYGSN